MYLATTVASFQCRVVQSPIKLTRISENFDFSFVTFWWGVLFILFALQFRGVVISNYTNFRGEKHFWTTKNNALVNVKSWVNFNRLSNNPVQELVIGLAENITVAETEIWTYTFYYRQDGGSTTRQLDTREVQAIWHEIAKTSPGNIDFYDAFLISVGALD